ncbi:MAG TPA: hypothetical protein VNF24_09085 [Candidatus Acidoferrales bacterium]|nr:hypothetical protein [Candidatus Acidoferrales bacterium]
MSASTGKLVASFACGRYDRTEALQTGEIRPDGMELITMVLSPADTFLRTTRSAEFDIAEMSLSGHILRTARGDSQYVGLPVFTSRVFRHQGVIVRNEVDEVEQLKGLRVAVPEYHMTAALFMRGLLRDDLGFDHRNVTWVQAGQFTAGRIEREALTLPDDVHVEQVQDRTIDDMLATNAVQAALTPYTSSLFGEANCPIHTLYRDPQAAAIEWYKRTKVFPIMHLIVVRRSIVERYPWAASNLVEAFTRAKDLCLERMVGVGGHPPVALPFLSDYIRDARILFGEDIWPYGLGPNLTTLETACRYSHEQGLSDRLVGVEELFAPESILPVYKD